VVFSGTVNDIANGIFDDSAVPPATTAPAAPTGLSAAGGTGEVTLTWSAVSNATSYNVYYATSTGVSKTTGTKIASVSTPYVHTGLTSGTTYYYVVTAVNSAGESSASPQKSATTASSPPVATVPAAPGSVSAAGGTKQVTLTWKAVNSATSYNIYYAQASGVTTATGTKIANVASPAVQTGLADSTTYFYIVTAVNSIGESAASAETSATTSATAPATCVACHAVPPASGAHTYHVKTKGYSCDKCHGAGYSSSAATAATHRNGVTDLSSSSGWDSSSQSCSNSCHGKKNW
jgi:predicted phage tail protein